nr:DUF3662 and FHA domain-containing protein [Corynebacterium macginleyi]
MAKLDSTMQRGLDNGMAFVFGGKVVPAEIDELVKQEAQDNLGHGDDNRLYSPNVMTVGVSSKDLENLSQDPNLPADCADQLSRFIRNNGWSLAGPVVVRIAEESGLRTGQLRVSSFIDHEPTEETGFEAIFHDFDGQEDQMTNPHEKNADDAATTTFIAQDDHPAPQTQGPAVNLMLQDGSSRVYHVQEGSNIIGRSNDADLRLPDTGVSRQHAEITWNGEDAVLVDLQSTNGTTVNDTPIDNWLLADGDVITMGHSHVEVRITGLDSHKY